MANYLCVEEGRPVKTQRAELHGNGNSDEFDRMLVGSKVLEISSTVSSDAFPRLVKKDGSFAWTSKKSIRPWHFFDDIFTTLVEIQWRLLLLVFCVVYFGSWLMFAAIWYLLLHLHGDFELEHYGNSSWSPCITELKDFTGAFLFSVETQHTTGYGWYHLTEECATTIITFCFQSIVGCILEGVLVGLIFVKIARGKRRTATLLFSNFAVLHRSPSGGVLQFKFRLADLRNRSNILQARIRAHLVTWYKTCEGSRRGDLAIGQYTITKEKLEVSAEGESDRDVLLFWPTTLTHCITEESPLHKILGQGQLSGQHFEVIVVLEGHCSATGQMTQARTSYLPSEIFVNHSFQPLVMKLGSKSSAYEIDYSKFNELSLVTD